MLNQIQNAIIKRLQQGFGSLANDIGFFFNRLENKEVFTKKGNTLAVLLTLNQVQIKNKEF